ncbi:hypothetical protein Moror_6192 [Moniliophthora roreri MCA 2997]|uniref:Uncharacterized protein n=1 Tax=Moniliophthora roreri (strain MCA 2997) TaxID=1381753 RepID=V2WSD5_MONRO|nr:hypothetical protein Moror_6192 [Moniliophthora roreri MCA 2997]
MSYDPTRTILQLQSRVVVVRGPQAVIAVTDICSIIIACYSHEDAKCLPMLHPAERHCPFLLPILNWLELAQTLDRSEEYNGYSYTITLEATKPIRQATIAKGDLEPRVGALPRRIRKESVLAPTRVVESKGFELFVDSGSISDNFDNDE